MQATFNINFNFNFNSTVNSGFDALESALFHTRNFANWATSESLWDSVAATVQAEWQTVAVIGAKAHKWYSITSAVALRGAIKGLKVASVVVDGLAWIEGLILFVWGLYVAWADNFVESRLIKNVIDVEVVEVDKKSKPSEMPKFLDISLRFFPLHGLEIRAFNSCLQWFSILQNWLRRLAIATVEKARSLKTLNR